MSWSDVTRSRRRRRRRIRRLASLGGSFVVNVALGVLFILIRFNVNFCCSSLKLLSSTKRGLNSITDLILTVLTFQLTGIRPGDHCACNCGGDAMLMSLLGTIVLLITINVVVARDVRGLFRPIPIRNTTVT